MSRASDSGGTKHNPRPDTHAHKDPKPVKGEDGTAGNAIKVERGEYVVEIIARVTGGSTFPLLNIYPLTFYTISYIHFYS